jgi:hypothetical protein
MVPITVLPRIDFGLVAGLTHLFLGRFPCSVLFDTPDHWVLSCSAKWEIECMVAGLLWPLVSS